MFWKGALKILNKKEWGEGLRANRKEASSSGFHAELYSGLVLTLVLAGVFYVQHARYQRNREAHCSIIKIKYKRKGTPGSIVALPLLPLLHGTSEAEKRTAQ